ncbi:DNA-binding protein [Sporolactobacillus sp. THM7-7]|nr:DNA-binding protein [Sporolactobacillus sp. THM7-7]
MTVRECAEYLRVCPDTIYRMCRCHQIPHRRIRNRIFFSLTTLERWEKENEQESIAN